MFARPNSFSAELRASGPIFMFCAPRHLFGGAEGVGSRFHVLRSRTHFRRFRGRRVPFSCFASPYMFSTVTRASGPDFMFCAPKLVIGGTEVVGSRFHVFDGTEGVGSRFHVLRSRTCFPRYRGHQDQFSCFACPYSFPAEPRASTTVFMFCAPVLVFVGTDGVGSRFHILRSRSPFPFSCFALPDSFPAVPRASGPVFIFCAPVLIFDGTEVIGSRFHVLRA
jgi:hypothetical protein